MRSPKKLINTLAVMLILLFFASAVRAADQVATVNVNTATQAELEALPGVGKKFAAKIIANRPYTSAEDLSKAGLSAKKIAKLKSKVTFEGVASASAPAAKASAAAVSSAAPSPAAMSTPKASKAKHEEAEATSATAQTPPKPGMVWVNSKTKVFHTEGDRYYGKTKSGKWMTEEDAVKAGYHKSKQDK